jgi:voltage-gated potassium channel
MLSMTEKDTGKIKLSSLNSIVLVLSAYVLIALLIDTLFILPTEISRLLDLIDNLICIFFLFEFFLRFYKSENKLKFLRWGWIDLISSIPTLDLFRAGRALRLFRLIRILRAFRSVRHLISHFYANKAKGTFMTVFIIALLMVIFSAIAILQVETDQNSNIKTAEDAIWWAYVTITTVGYGDKFPVTTEGRIIAAALMTVGVGVFGTFAGFLASWFTKAE